MDSVFRNATSAKDPEQKHLPKSINVRCTLMFDISSAKSQAYARNLDTKR